LVDTPASGAGDRKVVEVRVFFWAPIQISGRALKFNKNPRKRVFAFQTAEKNVQSLEVAAYRHATFNHLHLSQASEQTY
ncbi:hypothetical protein, partial [Pseudomonas sp. DC1.2]|uniref:hypothetical protein n=1 Tax=Pseudomonas sp. DC1.2 TaxID=3048622 RepID=UPI002B230D33